MHQIRCSSGRGGYLNVVRSVMQLGDRRSPRGQATLDLDNVMIRYESPYDALPLGMGRKISRRIAAVEAIQLIGGFHDPKLMLWASPNFAQFAEPSGMFWGAYGHRIGSQAQHVLRKLRDDPDTRQAVITLWNPTLDNYSHRRDYPCTVSLMYAIRNDQLCATTIMRSNDVWLGLPYDVFQFTQLQLTLATALGISAGSYTHFTNSLHLYERDLAAADQLHAPDITFYMTPHGISSVSRPMTHVDDNGNTTGFLPVDFQSRARRLAFSYDPFRLVNINESEKWYAEQLADFPGRHPGSTFVEKRVDDGRAHDGAA